jgi:hypothetical protein
MNETSEIKNGSVAALLSETPRTAAIFNHWKTACVGCHFARFCTLADVIAAYQLDEDTFLTEMTQSLLHHKTK